MSTSEMKTKVVELQGVPLVFDVGKVRSKDTIYFPKEMDLYAEWERRVKEEENV